MRTRMLSHLTSFGMLGTALAWALPLGTPAQGQEREIDARFRYQQGGPDRFSIEAGVEILTRGPVHEAFAEPVAIDPEPGIFIQREPPPPLLEEPPEEAPVIDGQEAEWIPGYWSWDEERQDYVWVSGTWRLPPPNSTWIPGYWNRAENGYQATSGFWLPDDDDDEIEYLPEPPQPLERGPVGEPPSPDYIWVAGSWYWEDSYDWPHGSDYVYDRGSGFELRINFGRERRNGYVWRPGYWMRARPDWVWCAAHYVWTPRGHVFVDGYWDYPLERRGMLFAPVYVEQPARLVQRNAYYSPSVLIDVDILAEHLFVGPRCQNYYFGDYYDVAYERRGILPYFEVGRRQYDPIFSYRRWRVGRGDPRWIERLERDYNHRRTYVEARPSRTYRTQQTVIERAPVTERRNLVVARSLREAVSGEQPMFPTRRLTPERRTSLATRSREVQNFQERRARWESGGRPIQQPNRSGVRERDNRPTPVPEARERQRVLTEREARERTVRDSQANRGVQRIRIERSPITRSNGEARARTAAPPRSELPEPRKLRSFQRRSDAPGRSGERRIEIRRADDNDRKKKDKDDD